MMPQCPAAGSSNDPEVTGGSRDRWVGVSDGTQPDQTECGTASPHPEEGSEGAGGGPRNKESRPVQDEVPPPIPRSPERGESRHHETQAVDPQKTTYHLSSAAPSPHVAPCSTQTTVVTPQPGVSQQIVLNFREQGEGLALDGVPPEAVSPCHGGCHVSQRVAKQIVLIFVNQPRESAKPTCSRLCGGPTCTVNASTQTSGGMCRMCRPHSDRRSPSKSPHRFVQNQSCGTQTEWGRRHEIPEHFPVHSNVSPMSHLVSQRTSKPSQTECTPRVPELPSSSCYAQTISQEEEGAPGLAFEREQEILTPSSSPDASSESCLSPADTLTNSWADKTRRCPLPVLETQDPPDHCLVYDRSSLFSCQTKVSNGSRDLTDSPSDLSTSCPLLPCKETQLSSEEPMETTASDDQTAGRHGDLNQQPSSEKSLETTISDEKTGRIHGELNHQLSIEKPIESTTCDGQTAGRHGNLTQPLSIEKPMETTTSEEETSIMHGELSQQPSIKKPMETTTSDGQTAERHGDQSQQPSIEIPMETTTSDEETARIHGNLNQQPSSEEAMENTSFDCQTAQKHCDHLLNTSSHILCSHTDQSKECPCVPGKRPPGLREDKPKITDDSTLKGLGRREPEHPSCSSPSNHSQKLCGTSCLSPSLSQYLGNLLEQHRMSLNEPVHHQKSPSSSSFPDPCSSPQPHVRQIILNFLEEESRPVNADVCSPSISNGTSSPSKNTAGDQDISHPASDQSSSLSESQNVCSLGTSLVTSMPGDQDVNKPGDSEDLSSSVLPNTAGDQDVPEPSNGSDMSSSEQLSSKPLSQDVSSPGTARHLSITSRVVNQDVPEPGSSKNSPSTLLSGAASRDLPGLSTAGNMPLPELTHKPENPDVAAPVTSSISSSSALINDKPVHLDVPGPRDLPSSTVLSEPERQDFLGFGSASDSSLQTTSVSVTQDVSSTGTPASDSHSVLPSRPVIQDIPGADSKISLPSTRDDTFAHTGSSHIASLPVSKNVPETSAPSSVLIRSRPEEAQVVAETPEGEMERPESPVCQPQRPPKSHSCPPLVLDAVTQEVELRLPATDRQELVGPLRRYSGVKNELTFDDIAVYFSKEEWEVLEGPQKGLYCQVMMDNYHSLSSLGFLLDKPGLISRIEDEEAELWEDGGARGGDLPPFPARCTADVPSLDDKETPGNVGGESTKSSSHLGALMRLVNEIPGFLLGGSSPGQNLEDAENIRPCYEVKTEENSPSYTPASVHTQRIGETPESSSPGAPWGVEKSNPPTSTKAEEVEIPIHPPYRQSQAVRHPHLPHIKSEPGACTGTSPTRELHIKQEDLPLACNPSGGVPVKQSDVSPLKIRSSHLYKQPGSWECRPADSGRQAGPADEENRWPSLPPSLPAGSFARDTSVSPTSLSDGASSVALKDLHIKIKQEDSGSERDPAESPVCGRKVPSSPMAPSPGVLEHLRLGASPRRSAMDRKSPRPQEISPGKSHLHGLVNCLKEISASRSWAQPNAPPPADSSRAVKRAALDSSSPSRVVSVLWRPPDEILKDEPYTPPSGSPNPFTVAVTNGSTRMKGAETKMAESVRPRVAEPPAGGALISVKCPDRVHTRPPGGQNVSGGGGFLKTEEPRRAELGVKRTHSDDPSRLSVKRPALDCTSPSRVVGTLWIPPDDGKCPLMSVRNCVRKIPSCWAPPPPPVRGPAPTSTVPEPCHTRISTQGGGMSGKIVEVKQEKSPSPIPTPTRQWAPPPRSPGSPDQSGTPSTNVHLSGLMRLMEEIPVAESSSSSRAMYNIAIGHSMMRRPDRTNFLSYYNDDGIFQADLNDNTVASVDSVYSDDTSLSSENLDPSYSAIGGLQRVVSEFAELGSVSPLVAVSVPQSIGTQEGHGLKAKEPTPGSAPRLNDAGRGSQRGMLVSTASACSAEDGEAAYAALCGLQKVVRGFNEQECVSPFSAVRSAPLHGGLRESLTKRSFTQEEEGESPRLPDSSPRLPDSSPRLPDSSPVSAARFLCEGSWLPKADSSYSALSGLQKVVNGFSDLGCVSPFSAVSTSASESAIEICSRKKCELPALDASCSVLCGLKKVVNGVPDSSCVSPATASSNPSSVGEPDPSVRWRCERSEVHTDSARSHGPSNTPQRNPPRPSGQCIDLTQEEEPAGNKAKTPNQDRQSIRNDRTPESSSSQAAKQMGGRTRPPASSQLIDLTEEEEAAPVRHKLPSLEAGRKSHSASPHKATSDRKHRAPITAARTRRVGADRPLDPGPSGARRGGIPTVNEHISGLEKLLKGVPTFTPPNTPSGQRRSGSWWFKSTSPHET